jgi:hypothetical protein
MPSGLNRESESMSVSALIMRPLPILPIRLFETTPGGVGKEKLGFPSHKQKYM